MGWEGGKHPNDQSELVRGWEKGHLLPEETGKGQDVVSSRKLEVREKRRRAVKVVMVRKKQRGGAERSGSASTDGEGVTPEQG